MGNYIFGEEHTNLKLKQANKDAIKFFRKKLVLYRIIDTMVVYADKYHPTVQLSFEQFDEIFCAMLNNTRPFYDILQEEGKVDIY